MNKYPDSYIFAALRRIFRWSAERRKVYDRQRRGEDKYQCEKCAGLFSRKKREVHIDHIIPVVDPHEGFRDWNTYISRMYVKAEEMQLLCKDDHKKKTNVENKIRRSKRVKRKVKKK